MPSTSQTSVDVSEALQRISDPSNAGALTETESDQAKLRPFSHFAFSLATLLPGILTHRRLEVDADVERLSTALVRTRSVPATSSRLMFPARFVR